MTISNLREAVLAVDRAWSIDKNAYDLERFHADDEVLIDRLRDMRRALIHEEVEEMTLRERLTPAWPGGGYRCLLCPLNFQGHVRPEAWAQTRHDIPHVADCPMKES